MRFVNLAAYVGIGSLMHLLFIGSQFDWSSAWTFAWLFGWPFLIAPLAVALFVSGFVPVMWLKRRARRARAVAALRRRA